MASRPKLRKIVAALEKFHGKPAPYPSNDPWELILGENASYLMDDTTREEVFRSLKARIGISPEAKEGGPVARKVLKRFPGIGEPGADKLLLAAGGRSRGATSARSRRAATTPRSHRLLTAGGRPCPIV